MTYDERIYELVKKKNNIELTEKAREIVDKAIEIATEIKADLDECEAEHKPHTKVVEFLQAQTEHFMETKPKPLKKDLQTYFDIVRDTVLPQVDFVAGGI